MTLSLRSIFLLVATLLFVFAAFGIGLGSVSIVSLGFAFFAGSFLISETGIDVKR